MCILHLGGSIVAYVNARLTEYKEFLRGKSASVLGLGISNAPLVTFLLDNGVKVVARDAKNIDDIRKAGLLDVDKCLSRGVQFVTGADYLKDIQNDIVFKSPGIRFDHEEILKAKERGSLITSEMEAFISLCPSKIIAISGSDGKTTTTTLVSEILKAQGKRVFLGGNIGTPLLSRIEEITPDDFTVLELSSFQLHTINRFENAGLPFAHLEFPDAAIITNVTPNHLNWHTDMQEYVDAKAAVFSFMKKGSTFVTNGECGITADFAKKACDSGMKIRVFSHDNDTHICEKDGCICVQGKAVLKISDIAIPGRHNVENYMAAIGATYDYVTAEAIEKVAKNFGGVHHRFELVKTGKNGVSFYNSSIDSSPTRTLAALSNLSDEYNGRIVLILGGKDKGLDFSELAKETQTKARCVIIYQDTEDKKVETAIRGAEGFDNAKVPLYVCDGFDKGVECAFEQARDNDIVLLSPACTSFGEFNNFEERGKRFCELVKNYSK